MKDDITFSDLDKQYKGIVASNILTLQIAFQLLEKNLGRQIVTKIIAQGIHTVNKMSDRELNAMIKQLEQDIAKEPKSSSIRYLTLTRRSRS